LRFEARQLRIHCQDPPWKVVRAFPQNGGPVLVHLHNISGGVLAGDRLALDIDAAPDAEAQITTTGATRLYRHRPGALDSEQVTRISVGQGAVCEYLPDPVIPYRGARHLQRTEIRLEAGATLFWWEVLAPGRQAAGEEFAFERLRIQNRVFSRRRPIVFENLCLEPGTRPLIAGGRMDRYRWAASFTICREGQSPALWRCFEDELNALAQERSQEREIVWGASTLAADGVTVRGLSRSGREIPATLTDFWRLARRRLTGAEAVPPRKVN
jgi:urease accessory protein